MKPVKILLLACALSFFSFSAVHKYYISLTQIEYLTNKKSVQIISRLFVDDFENALRSRYNDNITFGDHQEAEKIDEYIERYINDKLTIKINGTKANFTYIGKESDVAIIKCYLEIEGVERIDSFEVTNKLLFDLIEEQQNIVKTKINSNQKSVILIPQKDTAVLKFN
ncbi:DUF6702 family protein [Tamlana crocina]|uniref:Peptidase E n=1 Tax=Tamlana crocina TaxID=393006 RepID=A0ABX1D852_9FLAO|nr:DUF6702 family protein [Tamlana crocina]NJX14537.1 peptidase E [Tamlana crocina]